MEIYYIKVAGKANIPQALSLGHNFKIVADCSITSESRSDNQNGDFDVIYRAEPVTVTVERDNGEIVKSKDIRKNSQKIRNYCYRLWQENNCPMEFEDYYNKVTLAILNELPIIIQKIK